MVKMVYILGSTRSGTSALRNAVARTRYRGYGEGHMSRMLNELITAVREHEARSKPDRGNAHSKMRRTKLLRHLFAGYEGYLAEQMKTEYVLDKTPDLQTIQMAPRLNVLHSDVKFIHCARRHVDNIQSKLKKFPEQSFQQSCRTWARCNESWLDVKEKLEGRYLEFDFYDLSTDPARIAGMIAEFLELDASEQEVMATYLQGERPQAAADRDLTRFLKWSDLDWSDKDRALFEEICVPVGQRLGYGLDSYFEPADEPAQS